MGAITPDEPAMKALGDAMAAANEPDWISELGYETLCDITGATEDWNYFSQGTYGYTPEASTPTAITPRSCSRTTNGAAITIPGRERVSSEASDRNSSGGSPSDPNKPPTMTLYQVVELPKP